MVKVSLALYRFLSPPPRFGHPPRSVLCIYKHINLCIYFFKSNHTIATIFHLDILNFKVYLKDLLNNLLANSIMYI